MVFQACWPHLQVTILPLQMNSNPWWKSSNLNSRAWSHMGTLIILYVHIPAGTHACPSAHKHNTGCHWLLNIWMSESFSGRRQQQGQSEHLGRLQGGEWVCSSVGRLTHFIISLSHTPQIYCMHEWAMAIVKQAHVRTQHKAADGKIYGQHACFDSVSARWQIPTQNIYYICSYV